MTPRRHILGLVLLGCTLVAGRSLHAQVADEHTRIAFLSDTQQPTWIELFFLKVNQNELARKMIFRDILDADVASVIHLGDMISTGSSSSAWEPIDRFLDSLRLRRIDFHPIFGNHEYFLLPCEGRKNFRARFPGVPETGYQLRFSHLAVVLLNSNLSSLTTAEQQSQQAWYQETLQELDADSSVKFIIVGCHHSPYTNSTIVPPSKGVDTAFVPPFLAARKAVLFLSGHAHAFEHYQKQGKDFLVIGGGGGLQQPLLTGSRRRYDDLSPEGGVTRMFHYLLCNLAPDEIEVEVRMIKRDFSGFRTAVALTLRPQGEREVPRETQTTPTP